MKYMLIYNLLLYLIKYNECHTNTYIIQNIFWSV